MQLDRTHRAQSPSHFHPSTLVIAQRSMGSVHEEDSYECKTPFWKDRQAAGPVARECVCRHHQFERLNFCFVLLVDILMRNS